MPEAVRRGASQEPQEEAEKLTTRSSRRGSRELAGAQGEGDHMAKHIAGTKLVEQE